MVSKPHLVPDGCVAIDSAELVAGRFKMLTYSVYAPLLNRIDPPQADLRTQSEVLKPLIVRVNGKKRGHKKVQILLFFSIKNCMIEKYQNIETIVDLRKGSMLNIIVLL
jgi:hypothetical protein